LFATGRVEITNGSTAEEDWNAGIQIPERNAEDDLYIRNIGVEGNNVIIQTPHGTWTYGHDGTFNLPGLSGGIGSYVQATNDITINANGAEYRFKTDGSVVFPTLTTQRGDAYNGTISGQTLLFGDANQGAIITTPNGVEGNPYSQRLIINPGQGYDYGEGGDIYLWAGRGGSNNGSGGDLKIRGGDSFGSGESGYIRIEAGQVHGSGSGGEVRIVAGPSDSGNGGSIYIAGANGGNYGGGVTINGGYAGGEAGADVVITGGGSGWGAAYYGQVKINAVSGQWTFGRDGALTLPNGAKLNNGNGYQFATDNTVTTSLDLRDTTGRGFYTGDAGFTLRSNGTYNWIFGTDGSLTFPNNTVQTTAYQTATVPGSSKGVSGNRAGMVAFDSGNFYYCKQNYTDGVADIWVKTAWTSTSW
jgi:hypothetical protein